MTHVKHLNHCTASAPDTFTSAQRHGLSCQYPHPASLISHYTLVPHLHSSHNRQSPFPKYHCFCSGSSMSLPSPSLPVDTTTEAQHWLLSSPSAPAEPSVDSIHLKPARAALTYTTTAALNCRWGTNGTHISIEPQEVEKPVHLTLQTGQLTQPQPALRTGEKEKHNHQTNSSPKTSALGCFVETNEFDFLKYLRWY